MILDVSYNGNALGQSPPDVPRSSYGNNHGELQRIIVQTPDEANIPRHATFELTQYSQELHHHSLTNYGGFFSLQYPSALSQSPEGRSYSPTTQPQFSTVSSSQRPRTAFTIPFNTTQKTSSPQSMMSPSTFSYTSDSADTEGVPADHLASHADLYVDPSSIFFYQSPAADNMVMDHVEDTFCAQDSHLETYRANNATTTLLDSTGLRLTPPLPHSPKPTSQCLNPEIMDEDINQSDQSHEDAQTIFTPPSSPDVENVERPLTPPRHPAKHARSRVRGRPRGSKKTQSKITKNAHTRKFSPRMHGDFLCAHCPDLVFEDVMTLNRHTRTQHQRSYTCIFKFAGCNDAFSSKNEWKRHINSQHLSLLFWVCNHLGCRTPEVRASRGPSQTRGRPFRRKDLFTQHVRRMHGDVNLEDFGLEAECELGEELRMMQEHACHKRCELPEVMRCPVPACSQEFRGEKAWDEHLEHLARAHIEPAAKGTGNAIDLSLCHHKTLTDWASSKDVNAIRRTSTGWELCNVLKNISIETMNSL